MRYQLPRSLTAQSLDRPGNPNGALHLRPGSVVELSDVDLALLKKAQPKVFSRLAALPEPKKRIRPSEEVTKPLAKYGEYDSEVE
jgi:hypothetical protein